MCKFLRIIFTLFCVKLCLDALWGELLDVFQTVRFRFYCIKIHIVFLNPLYFYIILLVLTFDVTLWGRIHWLAWKKYIVVSCPEHYLTAVGTRSILRFMPHMCHMALWEDNAGCGEGEDYDFFLWIYFFLSWWKKILSYLLRTRVKWQVKYRFEILDKKKHILEKKYKFFCKLRTFNKKKNCLAKNIRFVFLVWNYFELRV